MIVWSVALALSGLAVGLIAMAGLVGRTRELMRMVRQSFWTVSDRSLGDGAKARLLRRLAGRLFAGAGGLFLRGIAALALPAALLWGIDRLRPGIAAEVLRLMASGPFLLTLAGVTVVAGVGWLGRRRRMRPVAAGGFENRYTPVEQWMHDLAFASMPAQIVLSRLETRVHRRRLRGVRCDRPVFICGLPRAGTTVLLNVLATAPAFVTHSYRRMPFLPLPLWWHRFSRHFRLNDAPRERAHGDGLTVQLDSPEALEEALWLSFWDEHYEDDRIVPWFEDERSPEFVRFFEDHMTKLALLAGKSHARYLSKNNGNIARVSWLLETFPDARVLIPFRSPLQHAQSLLRQHRHFLAIHERDPFARRYMAGLGHFDFGANLRPIDFEGWLTAAPAHRTNLPFWVAYWVSAYSALARLDSARILWVEFESLGQRPLEGLERIGRFLGEGQTSWQAAATQVHSIAARPVDMTAVPQSLLNQAARVHEVLRGRAAKSVATFEPMNR